MGVWSRPAPDLGAAPADLLMLCLPAPLSPAVFPMPIQTRPTPPRQKPIPERGSLLRHALATITLIASTVLWGAGLVAKAEGPPSGAAIDFFETSVRPVLVESCQKCHGPGKQASGLRVDSREAMLKGGDTGAAVVPGKPAESLLVQAVEQAHDDLKMPPKRKLKDPEIAALRALGRDRRSPGATRPPGPWPKPLRPRQPHASTGRSPL